MTWTVPLLPLRLIGLSKISLVVGSQRAEDERSLQRAARCAPGESFRRTLSADVDGHRAAVRREAAAGRRPFHVVAARADLPREGKTAIAFHHAAVEDTRLLGTGAPVPIRSAPPATTVGPL